jgi:hypothetical protein
MSIMGLNAGPSTPTEGFIVFGLSGNSPASLC